MTKDIAKELVRDICGSLHLDPILCELVITSGPPEASPEYLMLVNKITGLSINQLQIIVTQFDDHVDGIHAAGNVLVIGLS